MNKHTKAPPSTDLPMVQLSPLMMECLALDQEVILTVTGESMSPFLRHKRDQVVLVAADPTALQPGDVPLYRRSGGQYVLHRIVERDDGIVCVRWGADPVPSAGGDLRYTLLGDAQWQRESGVTPDQIVACATAFIRKGQRWECHSTAYIKNRLRWHRLLPLRRLLLFAYHLPGRVRYGVPRRLRRWLGRTEK